MNVEQLSVKVSNTNRFIEMTDVTDYKSGNEDGFMYEDFLGSFKLIQIDFGDSEDENIVLLNRRMMICSMPLVGNPSAEKILPFMQGLNSLNNKEETVYIPFFFRGHYKFTLFSIPSITTLSVANGFNQGDYGVKINVGSNTYQIWRALVNNPIASLAVNGFEDVTNLAYNGTLDFSFQTMNVNSYQISSVTKYLDYWKITDNSENQSVLNYDNMAYDWDFFNRLTQRQKDILSKHVSSNINSFCEKENCQSIKLSVLTDYVKRGGFYKTYKRDWKDDIELDSSENKNAYLSFISDVKETLNRFC